MHAQEGYGTCLCVYLSISVTTLVVTSLIFCFYAQSKIYTDGFVLGFSHFYREDLTLCSKVIA